MARIDLARALLRDCEKVYQTGNQSEDIPSKENVISTYRSGVNQKKYTHMFFAKSVACWRHLQMILSATDDPVVSIGAGPCLCLFGWSWDRPPSSGQTVWAVDVLGWEAVRGLASYKALSRDVLGDAEFSFLDGLYFPPACRPPQTQELDEIRPFQLDQLVPQSTVLLPFVLNHLVGLDSPVPKPSCVFDWLEEARSRAGRIVVADMPADRAGGFWTNIRSNLRAAGAPSVLTVDTIDDLADAYSQRARWPARRTSSYMRDFTALVGTDSGWRFL